MRTLALQIQTLKKKASSPLRPSNTKPCAVCNKPFSPFQLKHTKCSSCHFGSSKPATPLSYKARRPASPAKITMFPEGKPVVHKPDNHRTLKNSQPIFSGPFTLPGRKYTRTRSTFGSFSYADFVKMQAREKPEAVGAAKRITPSKSKEKRTLTLDMRVQEIENRFQKKHLSTQEREKYSRLIRVL